MKQSTQVVIARSEHLGKMGLAMAKAFQGEPNFAYILPDEVKREAALSWFFGVFTPRLGFRYGRVYTTPDAVGGAIWMAPGTKVTLGGALRAGLLSMPRRFGLRGLKRSTEVTGHIERMRKRSAPERHWYLLALGVDPSAQGMGVGSALLQPVLDEADGGGIPCYLETFSERNVAFYRRFGFEVVQHERFRKAGISFWGMVRQPQR